MSVAYLLPVNALTASTQVTKVVLVGDSRTDKRTLAAWLLGRNYEAARSEGRRDSAHTGHRRAATEARDGAAGGGADGKHKGRDESRARGRRAKSGDAEAKEAKEKGRVDATEEREPIQAASAGKGADKTALRLGDGPMILGVDLPDWVRSDQCDKQSLAHSPH